MQTNVCGIWKRLNEIDDSESLDLLEFARFPKTKDSELKEFEEHADKHRTYIINGKEYMMTMLTSYHLIQLFLLELVVT